MTTDSPRYDFAWAIENATYEEGVASDKYKKLVEDAQALGYINTSIKLNEIAVEELQHRKELQEIIRQTGTSTEALVRDEVAVKVGQFYYWEITNMVLGTRSQTDTPYVTPELAMSGGERYAVENLSHRRSDHMVIKIFDKSPDDRAGLTLEPLQSESFWIEDYLTREGSKTGLFYWNITDQDTLKVSTSPTGYRRDIDAEESARGFIVSDLDPIEGKYKIEVLDRYANVVKTLLPVPYGPPEERPFPKTYSGWVGLGEDIKKIEPTASTILEVNHALYFILEEEKGEADEDAGYTADDAKRWLTEKAGELEIK